MVTENRRETGFFSNFPIWKEVAVSTSLERSGFGGEISVRGVKNHAADRHQDQSAGVGDFFPVIRIGDRPFRRAEIPVGAENGH